jgi:hypothetical protein
MSHDNSHFLLPQDNVLAIENWLKLRSYICMHIHHELDGWLTGLRLFCSAWCGGGVMVVG